MKLIDIIDAVEACEKHLDWDPATTSPEAVSTCETCPSFEGIYVEHMDHTFSSMENAEITGGKKRVKCIYPKEREMNA